MEAGNERAAYTRGRPTSASQAAETPGRAIVTCKSTLTGHHGGDVHGPPRTSHHRFLISHQSLTNFLFPITPFSSTKGYRERAHRSICDKCHSQRLHKVIFRSRVGGGWRECLQRPPKDMLCGHNCRTQHLSTPLLPSLLQCQLMDGVLMCYLYGVSTCCGKMLACPRSALGTLGG